MSSFTPVSEALTVIANFLMAAAAIAGAIAAFTGLDTWKKERKWQKNSDLSEELLVLFYQRENAIKALRQSSFTIQPAEEDMKGQPIADEETARYYGMVNYYQRHIERFDETLSDLNAKELRASAIWGKELEKLSSKLYEHEAQLFISMRRYLRSIDPKLKNPRTQENSPVTERTLAVLYDTEGSEDEFAATYSRLFSKIENYLRSKFPVI